MAKRIFCFTAAVITVTMLFVLAAVITLDMLLPDRYYVAQGEEFSLPESSIKIKAAISAQNGVSQCFESAGSQYPIKLSLPCGAVIKTASVEVVRRDMVIPAGTPFGIKMFTDGVMVVGLSDLDIDGKTINPAKTAGIKTGDVIMTIDGQKVNFNEDVGEIVSKCGGKAVDITFMRDGEVKSTTLIPQKADDDGGYRAGMWVRDSSAGIGTMTYFDPKKNTFAGLGHAICDVDTGELMPLSTGEAVDVTITGVTRGSSGFPGELRGAFTTGRVIGELKANNETGIYGYCKTSPAQNEPIPLATRSEVHTGPAQIYSTVSGIRPQSFDVFIERVAVAETASTKNMVIKVTDPELIEITGGIVQGMSGSPIIQDGKLVGAVTHVFVNDPTKGYGIFIENMLDAAG